MLQMMCVYTCSRSCLRFGTFSNFFPCVSSCPPVFCPEYNSLSQKNCTPLHVAARYNHTEVCRFLMSQGADMNIKDSV